MHDVHPRLQQLNQGQSLARKQEDHATVQRANANLQEKVEILLEQRLVGEHVDDGHGNQDDQCRRDANVNDVLCACPVLRLAEHLVLGLQFRVVKFERAGDKYRFRLPLSLFRVAFLVERLTLVESHSLRHSSHFLLNLGFIAEFSRLLQNAYRGRTFKSLLLALTFVSFLNLIVLNHLLSAAL